MYYAARALSSCIVEVFGDTRIVEFGEWHVASPSLNRSLTLLDLRGNGSMQVGSVAALSKIADYPIAQAWSRYFYDNPAIFRRLDGLLYLNAHNDAEALALYERASGALVCPEDRIIRLDNPKLRPTILDIAAKTNLVVL